MGEVRVRQDVWELGDETDPWANPVILAYARAVGAMQKVDATSPGDGRSWMSQAAIHGTDTRVPGRLENECQHGSWFFLPWHRMYLYRFEEIVRSHLDEQQAGTWALPYWNYTDSPVFGSRALPPAFRQPSLPDGDRNPLFTPQRQTFPRDVNAGEEIPAAATSIADAMAEARFSRTQVGATFGFGGRPTRRRLHGGSGLGQLEGTPHGNIHVAVGGLRVDPATGQTVPDGLMSSFETAALDPIFWLHHANIDRLWEVWLRDRGSGRLGENPTSSVWLEMDFELTAVDGNLASMRVEDVLDIESQLGYTYTHLPKRRRVEPELALAERRASVSEEPEHPPEMIGAVEEALTLDGGRAEAALPLQEPTGPMALGRESTRRRTTYLNIENIEGETNPGLLYGVYLNLPPGKEAEPESEHYVGTISFFGIEDTTIDDDDEEAPHGLRYVFDISDLVDELSERDQWDPNRVDVTFSPIGVDDATGAEMSVPPVRIGRVSLFVE